MYLHCVDDGNKVLTYGCFLLDSGASSPTSEEYRQTTFLAKGFLIKACSYLPYNCISMSNASLCDETHRSNLKPKVQMLQTQLACEPPEEEPQCAAEERSNCVSPEKWAEVAVGRDPLRKRNSFH